MSQSKVFDVLGIGACLRKAAEFLGLEESTWNATGPDAAKQTKLIASLPSIGATLDRIKDIVRSWASTSAADLNAILRQEGFEIQLQEWPQGGRRFGVVAILEILVHWLAEGKKATVKRNGQDYPAFKLKGEDNGIEFYRVRSSAEPVVKIATKSGDTVFLHKVDAVDDDFGIYDAIARLRGEMRRDWDAGYEDVIVPKIKLRQEVDLGWLVGLNIEDWEVAEAKQEVRFVMNEKGAHAKTATAMAMRSFSVSMGGDTYTFDSPFLFWMERDGVELPTFVAHLGEANWQDPGSLDNI